ncbi:MAG: hypothetical protein V4576_04070 [Patescibacteria group bacterium]
MNFLELLEKTRETYKKFERIYSPAINSVVHFNSKGFNHITFKNPRKPRATKDQINRLKIVEIAYQLVKHSNTFQEYELIQSDKNSVFQYWGLIAIFKNTKLKVILRKVSNGNVHFWSVIPFYTTSEKRDGNFKMKGDVEID